MKYKFIKENGSQFSVEAMCKFFEVSRSGYYDWVDRPVSNRSKANQSLLKDVKNLNSV